VLLLQLSRAVSGVVAIDPAVEASLALPVPPVHERVLPLLDEALAEASPFLLVLDDAHLLAGPKCWDVIAFVLRGLPPGAQLALGTRAEPALALARSDCGEVAEFRAADLAFDRGEAEHLLRAHGCGPIDAATLDALFEVTEGERPGCGWRAARRERGQGQWLPRVRGDGAIATYLPRR
jgi:LuxR family maltose regulon positive regulatory protein